MEKDNLNNYLRGWILGNFEPSLVKTDEFEIGIKKYKKFDNEEAHYHKLSTEWTVVIYGVIKMNDVVYVKDDIIKVGKFEVIKFECVEDATTLVIKSPHVKGDKYLVEE